MKYARLLNLFKLSEFTSIIFILYKLERNYLFKYIYNEFKINCCSNSIVYITILFKLQVK